MNPAWIHRLWTLIGQEWKAIPEAERPWGVWITRHGPLAADADYPSLQQSILLRAWFLGEGMATPDERGIWAFTRFRVMHFERPWDTAYCASADPRFRARCFPLGIASFAPYVDSQDICLETLWGGLWGIGRRLTLAPGGVIERTQLLWIA